MPNGVERFPLSLGERLAGFLLVLAVAGCSTSSTTRETERLEKPTGVVQDVDEFVYLAKIKREKEREDDKRVDLRSLNSRRIRPEDVPASVNRDQFLLEVVSYLGVRYSYGGVTTEGMDCSGFTCQVFKRGANTDIPRSTAEQFRSGRRVSREELRFGDLVFFNTTGESPSHVGIYLEDDIFAHASVVEGVTLSSLESTYYKKRFVGARRVLD
jgi:hypothetical protein